MLKTILIIVSLFLFSCNPVKNVLKSQDKTEKVVREYVKKNPPKNDTLFIEGDTTVIYSTIVDSVPLPYPVNHKYTETHYIDRTITDTIKVIDRSFITALNNRLTAIENSLIQMTKEKDYWQGEARKRLYFLLGIITLILGGITFYVVKYLKPTINIGK